MEDARILIVEDDVITARDIEDSLKKLGYRICAVATSGEKALEKVEALKPDLILMDIQLKNGIDGIETSEQIKSSFNVPVVFLTAFSDNATLSRAKCTEPFGYILKPFEERLLHSTIEMALHKHSLEHELKRTGTINAALAELSKALLSLASLEEISLLVLSYARHLTESTYGFVGYLASRDAQLRIPAIEDGSREEGMSGPVFEEAAMLQKWVIGHGTPFLSNEPKADPRGALVLDPCREEIRNVLSMPAVVGEELVGQLVVAHSKRDYSQWDLEVMEKLSMLYALAVQRKKDDEERESLILRLQNALVNVKTLSGLLPICSSCKKIRDDKGYWQQIELYLQQHSEADFSHSLCPSCIEKLYADLDGESVREA
ncbi:MAG: response regulator [Candidatus Eremiobacteraeota bacterium]|nr:response regulator [Candidatus Eremiobacteraeota bacterium]